MEKLESQYKIGDKLEVVIRRVGSYSGVIVNITPKGYLDVWYYINRINEGRLFNPKTGESRGKFSKEIYFKYDPMHSMTLKAVVSDNLAVFSQYNDLIETHPLLGNRCKKCLMYINPEMFFGDFVLHECFKDVT